MLGTEEFAQSVGPMSHNGKTFFMPTKFENLGPKSIKESRCYSTSMTHQHPRALVGPTAGVKVFGEGMQENEIIRKQVIEVRKTTLVY